MVAAGFKAGVNFVPTAGAFNTLVLNVINSKTHVKLLKD